jgi:hypothetical protein
MRYYINISLGKNSVYGRPSCTLFRFRVVIMTTLDHAVEEGCRRILLEEEKSEGGRGEEERGGAGGRERGREEEREGGGGGGGINLMFSCLLLRWLVW